MLHVDYCLTVDRLPADCIADCGAGGGAKDAPVAFWREELGFTVNRANALRCLKGYGAWEPEELAEMSDEDLAEKVLWLACGDFAEQKAWEEDNPDKDPRDSDYGSDIFCLE